MPTRFTATGWLSYDDDFNGSVPDRHDEWLPIRLDRPEREDHGAFVQQAVRQAGLQGRDIILGEGEWNFRVSGGVVIDNGVTDGSAAGFYVPKIRGLGPGLTKILAPNNGRAITYVSAGRNFQGGGVFDLQIVGTGINSGAVGIQFGGITGTQSDLTTRMQVRNVQIDNVTSCFIIDDCSILDMEGIRLVRYKYGFQWGYNVDDVRLKSLYAGHEQGQLSGAACVITSGSNVITGLGAFITNQLQVGYCVAAPGRFPAGCYVGSIGPTSVTVVNHNGVPVNASANGGVVNFPLGRLFCFGSRVPPVAGSLYPDRGSPFVSPFWVAFFPNEGGRVNATNHLYDGLANDQEIIMDMGGGSHFLVTLTMYQERFARLYYLGDPGSDSQPIGIRFERNYYGQTQTVVDTPILIGANGQEFGLTIVDSFSDSGPLAYPWLRCDGFYGSGRLTWERNNLLTTALGIVQLAAANIAFAAKPVMGNGALYLGSARKGDAIEQWNNPNWSYFGQDVIVVPLAGGSKTILNPLQYNILQTGKELTIRIIADGASTLTLGSWFLNAAGTGVGTIAAGTTGQVMEYVFRWTGTKFIAQNNPVWVTP